MWRLLPLKSYTSEWIQKKSNENNLFYLSRKSYYTVFEELLYIFTETKLQLIEKRVDYVD